MYSACMIKHPSQKVMNFRHLLVCDTIVNKNKHFQNLSLPGFILWNFFIPPVEIIKKNIFTNLGLL